MSKKIILDGLWELLLHPEKLVVGNGFLEGQQVF